MNANKVASIAILLVGMGLFNAKAANAKLAEEVKTQLNTPANQVNISQSSPYTIAQVSRANSPLYGTWKLNYSIDGILYESFLIMNGYTGGMGTTYFDPNIRKTRVISQYMELGSSSQGLILIGSNPIDYYTNRPANYNPDNFLMSIQPNGSLIVVTCDRASRCSNVDIQAVK
ncbi:RDD domain-containing protein [Calothrix sp. NIES-4101]|nr:RDD domain-containing protein [Calothrix sp. NIES-4101]